RPRHTLFHVGRRRARHLHEHVHHRDNDLGLLFARQRDDRQRAERHRGDDDQRGQFRMDERRRQSAGHAVGGSHQRPPVVTRRPSVTVEGAATITTSPSDRPASTSVPLTFTSLTRAMSFSTTKADVICPRCTSAPAGTVRARRARALKCARPNIPERRPTVSGSVILTRNARASASTARPISTTLPLIVVASPEP